MVKLLRKIPVGVLSALFLMLILYYCLVPRPIGVPLRLFPGADKVAHFIMFFVLSASFIFDYGKAKMPRRVSWLNVLLMTVISIIIGGVIEILQDTMGLGRSKDGMDLLADAVGAVCAMVIMKLWLLEKLLFDKYC